MLSCAYYCDRVHPSAYSFFCFSFEIINGLVYWSSIWPSMWPSILFIRSTVHAELKMKNVLNSVRQVCRHIRCNWKKKICDSDRIFGKYTANYNSLHLSWEMLQHTQSGSKMLSQVLKLGGFSSVLFQIKWTWTISIQS